MIVVLIAVIGLGIMWKYYTEGKEDGILGAIGMCFLIAAWVLSQLSST